MLNKEYRILLPLTVDEYRIAQLYMIMKKSKQDTSGAGSGVEILKNEPYTDGPGGDGQYTYKVFHIGSHLPAWFRSILPSNALRVEEEAWNAYPYTKTRYTCPFIERFSLEVETRYYNDAGDQANVFNLSNSELRNRTIDVMDIVNDPISAMDYHQDEDPKLFQSKKTGRGPLDESWVETCVRDKLPIMCSYKLCKVEFRYWGMQTRVEKFIHDIALRKTMLRAHRQAWAWQDEWFGMTIEEIRRLEREAQEHLAEVMAKALEAEGEQAASAAIARGEGPEEERTTMGGEKERSGTPVVSVVSPALPHSVSGSIHHSSSGGLISKTISEHRLGGGRASPSGSYRSRTSSVAMATRDHFESIRADDSDGSDVEYFDAPESQKDEAKETSFMAHRPHMVHWSSMEMMAMKEEGGGESGERGDKSFFSSSSPISLLILVFHGGSVMDPGGTATSQDNLNASSASIGATTIGSTKQGDIATLKATIEAVMKSHYPQLADRLAIRLVACPSFCADAISLLSKLCPYGMEQQQAGQPPIDVFCQPALVALMAAHSQAYEDCVAAAIHRANTVYNEFLNSEEGIGFTGEVYAVGDALGGILAYDALLRHKSALSRNPSQISAHSDLSVAIPEDEELDGSQVFQGDVIRGHSLPNGQPESPLAKHHLPGLTHSPSDSPLQTPVSISSVDSQETWTTPPQSTIRLSRDESQSAGPSQAPWKPAPKAGVPLDHSKSSSNVLITVQKTSATRLSSAPLDPPANGSPQKYQSAGHSPSRSRSGSSTAVPPPEEEHHGHHHLLGLPKDHHKGRLLFRVSNLFLFGTPLGLLLAARRLARHSGQHVLESLHQKPACNNVYNLYYAIDPCCARLEPLLCPRFSRLPPVNVPRYQRFPLGDGASLHLLDWLHRNHELLSKGEEGEKPGGIRTRKVSNMSTTSEIEGIMGASLVCFQNIVGQWWGLKRVDYALYCPEGLANFPLLSLPNILHASFWESSDVAAFILRQFIEGDDFAPAVTLSAGQIGSGGSSRPWAPLFVPETGREKWEKRRTSIKLKNATANHRANDLIVNETDKQVINARFMYGPLDVVALGGEKVNIYIRREIGSNSGEWMLVGTEWTDSSGRISFTVSDSKKLPLGVHPVKILVRGDHTYLDMYVAVVPPQTECVVFSIDGSFTASMSVTGKDPKVRPGAVDIVRHWQDLGYLIIYVTARPDMQQRKVVSWLAQHNFPHGMLFFTDGISTDPLRQKTVYLQRLVEKCNVVLHAGYGSSKDISCYAAAGIPSERIFVVGKCAKKLQTQCTNVAEGFSVHLVQLTSGSLQNAGRAAQGNGRLILRKDCFSLPGQYRSVTVQRSQSFTPRTGKYERQGGASSGNLTEKSNPGTPTNSQPKKIRGISPFRLGSRRNQSGNS